MIESPVGLGAVASLGPTVSQFRFVVGEKREWKKVIARNASQDSNGNWSRYPVNYGREVRDDERGPNGTGLLTRFALLR